MGRISIEPCANDFVSDIFIHQTMATMDSDSGSSYCDDEVIDDSAAREYDSAPRDVYGVHDTDGSMIAVRKGQSLPFTSKYKRKNSTSKLVKFHVKKNLQCEVFAVIDAPKLKKKKSSEISHEKGDGGMSLAGKQSPQLSSPSEKSPQSSQLSSF